MDKVGYAEPTYPVQGADERLDTRGYEAAGSFDPGRYDVGDGLGPLMERAIGEQIAEQRMIREALVEFDRRLEILERTVADRLVDLERQHAQRIDHFEHSVTEQMAAFEAVLKRVVDRLTGAEERLVAGLEHNDKVVRLQLDALRPMIDAAAEMLAGQIEQGDRVLDARLEALRPTVEAAVLTCVGPELERALDEMRASLDLTERKLRRDVNQIAHMVRGGEQAEPFPGFEPVIDEIDLRDDGSPDEGDSPDAGEPEEAPVPAEVVEAEGAAPARRRKRPLRARQKDQAVEPSTV